MDAPPPSVQRPRFPPTFWVTVAFLVPASILRALTVTGSLRCLGAMESTLLVFPYALLLALGWLLRNTRAAAMVVAVGAVVITALPLTLGLWLVARGWRDAGGLLGNSNLWCGEGALVPGLFAGLQFVVAILAGVLAGLLVPPVDIARRGSGPPRSA